MSVPPEPSWPAFATRWSVEPVAVVLLAGAAAAYVRGRRRIRSAPGTAGPPALFWAGLAAVGLAVLSPLATYAEALLSVHMVQHLLLVLVAAPLLVASRPGAALLAGLPRRPVLLHRPVPRALTHPLVAWVAFAATGWAVHFTPLFDLALRHPAVHAAEHALFLGSALVFWRPVVGPAAVSHPVRLLYLGLAMPQNTFLAVAIHSAGRPLYEAYAGAGRPWGPGVLEDQRLAGGIMWVAGDLALLVAVLAVAAGWAAHDRDRELELDGPVSEPAGPAAGTVAPDP